MILVFGGTTEGRKAVATLDKAGEPYFYSTKGDLQQIESPNAVRLSGAMDCEQISGFCRRNSVKVIVDAAHPFASRLHSAIAEASREVGIPVIRYERRYAVHDGRLIWCDDYQDAVGRLRSHGIGRLLALTGVQTIPELKGFWKEHLCFFRILKRDESLAKAAESGFREDRLVFYDKDGDIGTLLDEIRPDAIITKESGESGGFKEKVEAALGKGVKVFVVRRPKLPAGFIVITGEYGLRKAIEKTAPGFFRLRSGYTTGACATAAAKAALLALTEGEDSGYISFAIPDGEEMSMKIHSVRVISADRAEASVIKDAGDDPDVTDGCMVKADVRLADHHDVHFYGGEGIGTVTLPGTGLEIGEPAINPVPRQMMREELLAIYPSGCDVTLSVPGGEALALKTFNARIGIVGGISIIGTSGIVMPFSNEAFMEAIGREMEVAMSCGCERIVLNSGARSEKVVRERYPELPSMAFIHYGNAIGESLKMASDIGIKRLTLGVMLGKAVKLAEGNTDTHSHKVTVNRDFLANEAEKAGCGAIALQAIRNINMARELWTLLQEEDAGKFFPHILRLCYSVCRKCYPDGDLTLMLITDAGQIFLTI
ncbi:MAG: cobalt-precorrin-5B (C(1))-methyltransferase CbiD [Bacteroidales bacterium]|nr:cobalt-precorrin-5B (C(1))-methyltransferase CbiD [Bacteroidales bacterium]